MIELTLCASHQRLPSRNLWLQRSEARPDWVTGTPAWRASRWAAKTLFCGEERCSTLRRVRIVHDAHGAPLLANGPYRRSRCPISLSHAGACGLAGIWRPRQARCAGRHERVGLGVDVATLDLQAWCLANRFLLDDELEGLTARRATVLWTLKEAAMKALQGRSMRFCDFQVCWSQRSGRASIDFVPRCGEGEPASLIGWFGIHRSHAWAAVAHGGRSGVRLSLLRRHAGRPCRTR